VLSWVVPTARRSIFPRAARPKDLMKDMTQKQALAEAVRRWGPSAMIQFRPSRSSNGPGRLARYSCTVGSGQGRTFHCVEGQGNTWREAFDDAGLRS
jgi:hypothetical protein